jgi:hypothetical protein
MNFSNEELYYMYGQYDTNISITFFYNSDAYKIFGKSLMGSIIYTEEERRNLEIAIKANPIERTEKKIRLLPSVIEKLSGEQYEQAERYGILCSDIYEILSYKMPRRNNFTENAKKEVQKTITVNFNAKPREINELSYGFLNSRFSRKEPLSPDEINKYLGLRAFFNLANNEPPYSELPSNADAVNYYRLNAKFIALTIDETDMPEFAKLMLQRHQVREGLIRQEIERSGEKFETVAKAHGDEIKNLRDACHGFEERVIIYGEKLIYLDLERFLHIYARHVTETQVGGQFAIKTVFQYKYDDIIRIIKVVVEQESDAIQEHFQATPEKNFVRIGKRSAYYDGHYYRLEIDTDGRLLTFHPYNNNEERDADSE